jgi:GTPase SAR1 family protein
MLQSQALNILKSGKNVFLTGSAGTGKTYTLNQYIQWLKDHRVPVAITASTGIAATHMNGTTIHSWSGIGIRDVISLQTIENLRTKKYLMKGIENTEVLIIDEISMLHRNQVDMVNQVLKSLKNNPAPFGAMQVVFSGDFFQLPPVSRTMEPSREKFAFMSNAWQEAAPHVCYLTEQFRQTDNDLNEILNKIRSKTIEEESISKLKSTITNTHSIEPTQLYSHNADVDRINSQELLKLKTEARTFMATKTGNSKLMESFEKSLIVLGKLELKIGAKVMFLKNNHEVGYMNGTLGTVSGYAPTDDGDIFPLVRLSDGRNILAEPELWSINNEKGTPVVKFEQVPLRLAWAITVHKSQGMTLEAAEIDLTKSFEAGQGYVALSRLQDLKGLKLLGLNETALKVDDLAYKADLRFAELSLENEILANAIIEKEMDSHILRSGGTIDKAELKKHKAKRVAKEKKISTYMQTAELVKKEMPLEKIAEERGYAISTIQGHILYIVDHYKDINVDYLKPEPVILDLITKKYAEIEETAKEEDYSKDGRLNSSLIWRALDGKYDYGVIKLAYAFITE